jgi:DNA-binding CsgD family transcriptional regulator
LQEWAQARPLLRQALTLALNIHYLPYLASIFYSAALLLIATGEAGYGVTLLAATVHHFRAPRVLANEIQRRLNSDLRYLAGDFLAATHKVDATLDLEATARDLLKTLASPSIPPRVLPPTMPTPAPIESLSERELECLRLIAMGLKNREIADQLFISVNTVRVHINNIYGKLGVSGRVQAVARAQELALL